MHHRWSMRRSWKRKGTGQCKIMWTTMARKMNSEWPQSQKFIFDMLKTKGQRSSILRKIVSVQYSKKNFETIRMSKLGDCLRWTCSGKRSFEIIRAPKPLNCSRSSLLVQENELWDQMCARAVELFALYLVRKKELWNHSCVKAIEMFALYMYLLSERSLEIRAPEPLNCSRCTCSGKRSFETSRAPKLVDCSRCTCSGKGALRPVVRPCWWIVRVVLVQEKGALRPVVRPSWWIVRVVLVQEKELYRAPKARVAFALFWRQSVRITCALCVLYWHPERGSETIIRPDGFGREAAHVREIF